MDYGNTVYVERGKTFHNFLYARMSNIKHRKTNFENVLTAQRLVPFFV